MDRQISYYIKPFQHLNNMLKALTILQKLKYLELDYMNVILDCVNHFTNEHLNVTDIKEFSKRVEFFGTNYPTNYINTLDEFKVRVDAFLLNRKVPQRFFITNRLICFKCNGMLDLKKKQAVNAVYFSAFSGPIDCLNGFIECAKCYTKHFISYCVQSSGDKFFYDNVLLSESVSFTKSTVYESRIFDLLSADIHFKHSSYQGFCASYNSVFQSKTNNDRKLNDLRLAETWLYYNLLKYVSESQLLSKYNAPAIEDLDKALGQVRPNLFTNFVKKWTGPAHHEKCLHSRCTSILNVDGNWKINRLKCMFIDVVLQSPELEDIVIGCVNTPKRGSLFCEEHLEETRFLRFHVNNVLVNIEIESIFYTKNIKATQVFKIHDYFYHSEMKETDILYLVSLINDPDRLVWVKEKDLNIKLLNQFNEDQSSWYDEDIYKEVSCNTNKNWNKGLIQNKGRTRGLLLSAYNCGIVNGFRELHCHESVRQVLLYYMDLIEITNNKLPKYFLYDDACHLLKYMINNKINAKSKRGKLLANHRHFVDKLHIQNHTNPWCLKYCHPSNEFDLNEVNTVVCEQLNFWLSRFKHIAKHMSYNRFMFFFYVVLNRYNEEKLKLHIKNNKNKG